MEAGAPPPAQPPPAAQPPAGPGPAGAAYPIRYDVEFKEEASRLTTFFRYFMVIPQYIVLIFVGIAAFFAAIYVWFVIVFTGKAPEGAFNFIVKFFRWSANVQSYYLLMRDEYPPFNGEPGQYPVHVEVDSELEGRNRLTVGLRFIWAIPAQFVAYFVSLIYIVVIVQWFAIVFTGKQNKGMFDLLVGAHRWIMRVQGYGTFLLTDKYPPFSLE